MSHPEDIHGEKRQTLPISLKSEEIFSGGLLSDFSFLVEN